MAYIDLLQKMNKKTDRDYVQRVVDHDKAECAEVAIQYGRDYWDGDRRFGYGGYKYDGRWLAVAEEFVKTFKLEPGMKILDVGCGKGFLLYEFTRVLPDVQVFGLDISQYAIENAKPEIKGSLTQGNATKLPYEDQSFDFVYSITTFHNLYNYELHQALKEVERVGRGRKYIVVESYRNEREKANLLYWQLTCRSFYTPAEWEFAFAQAGYTGDYGCIYFE